MAQRVWGAAPVGLNTTPRASLGGSVAAPGEVGVCALGGPWAWRCSPLLPRPAAMKATPCGGQSHAPRRPSLSTAAFSPRVPWPPAVCWVRVPSDQGWSWSPLGLLICLTAVCPRQPGRGGPGICLSL